MRKWLPLAILGAGGLGALLFTEVSRSRWAELAEDDADTPLDFNQQAQRELERIRAALNRVAEVLEPSH